MSLFSGGGRATILGGRVIIFFPLVWGRDTIFSRFLRGGSGFSLLTCFVPSVKEKCPEGRNKTICMNLDVRS